MGSTDRTLSRRAVLLSGGLAAAAVATGAGYALTRPAPFEGKFLTVDQAHKLATDGDIFLIDIRRPDEWASTGIGAGAHPIDMRRPDFVARLAQLVSEQKNAQIALICARGVRSNRLSARLTEAGLKNIIDVPEGMLGSRAGPGWLRRKLPVRFPG